MMLSLFMNFSDAFGDDILQPFSPEKETEADESYGCFAWHKMSCEKSYIHLAFEDKSIAAGIVMNNVCQLAGIVLFETMGHGEKSDVQGTQIEGIIVFFPVVSLYFVPLFI